MRHMPLARCVAAAFVMFNCGGTRSQTLPAPPVSPAPVVNYEYDAEDNPTKTVQAPGVSGFNFTTVTDYTRMQLPKEITDARGGVTLPTFGARPELTKVTDPRGLVTETPRNGLGDITSLISPDTGTATHTHDAAGNLVTRTDSRAVLATHGYDALNRLTSTVFSKSGQTSESFVWNYDQTGTGYSGGAGRLTSTAHPAGSTQMTYSARGRVLKDTQRVSSATGANAAQISNAVTYTYSSTDRTTSIVYPSGRKLTITNTGGKATKLELASDATAAATTLIDQVQWEPFGAPKSWDWQMTSGTQAHARTHDAYGRLVRYRMGPTVRDLTYDTADRITAYTHYDATTAAATPALDQSFAYDELARVTGITTAGANWTITYDANGNRTGVTLNGSTRVYNPSTVRNRLNSITNPTRSFTHDAAGNITADTGSPYTATYNLAGRLATMTKGGTTTTYSYDANGQRVRKFSSTGAASTVIFVYDQDGQLLGEYSNTGAAIREYVWLESTPVAIFTPDPANAANPPLVYYVHTDHLDTPRAVVDRGDNLRWRWLAEPFGTTAPEANPAGLGVFTQNLRFPGQYADQESGLSYNYFRDYDPSIGRYVQSDPIGLAGGINTYSYVDGNPVSDSDPFGLYTEVIRWAASPGLRGSWGHISGNINGRNFSFGPQGWDEKYPTAQQYADRQRSLDINREGAGIVLKLSPAEEAKLAQCLRGFNDYSGFSNNCGNPFLRCLEDLGVVFPGNRPQVLPEDVLKIIGGSSRAASTTSYPGTIPLYGFPKKP